MNLRVFLLYVILLFFYYFLYKYHIQDNSTQSVAVTLPREVTFSPDFATVHDLFVTNMIGSGFYLYHVCNLFYLSLLFLILIYCQLPKADYTQLKTAHNSMLALLKTYDCKLPTKLFSLGYPECKPTQKNYSNQDVVEMSWSQLHLSVCSTHLHFLLTI